MVALDGCRDVQGGLATGVELGVLPGDRFEVMEAKGRVSARQQAYGRELIWAVICPIV